MEQQTYINHQELNKPAEPLVSIIVITYNSSKYVLETLESAKAQTYRNIELIVSDDWSTDDTVEICHNWIDKNKSRFKRTELITFDKNSGISANCNRGVKDAQGEWVKLIAGDDLLLPNCISDNIDYVSTNSDIKIVFSDVLVKINSKLVSWSHQKYDPNITAKHQFLKLLKYGNYFPSATLFINLSTIASAGYFDERFPMMEDYPLFIKLAKNRIKLYHFSITTVIYRLHEHSISTSLQNSDVNSIRYFESMNSFFEQCVYSELIKRGIFIYYIHWKITLLVYKLNLFYPTKAGYIHWIKYMSPLNFKNKIIHLVYHK
jgi:alpha-1,3-rhamnosyltransferase